VGRIHERRNSKGLERDTRDTKNTIPKWAVDCYVVYCSVLIAQAVLHRKEMQKFIENGKEIISKKANFPFLYPIHVLLMSQRNETSAPLSHWALNTGQVQIQCLSNASLQFSCSELRTVPHKERCQHRDNRQDARQSRPTGFITLICGELVK